MNDTCFVITPIGQPNSPQRRRADRLCDQIVGPALAQHESKLTLMRGDRMQDSGPITVQIIVAITDARLVIADLVDPNPNVYYELGIAEAFQKPIIRLSASGTDPLPFDVRDMRTVDLPRQTDGGIDVIDAFDATDKIVRMLPQLLAPEYRPVSIVSLAERRARLESLTSAVAKDSDGQSQLLKELATQVVGLRDEVQRMRQVVKVETPPRPPQSLGFGAEVLAKHLNDTVTVAEIENELQFHPNPVTMKDVEIVLGSDGTKTLVLHGGRIEREDFNEMSAFWRGFQALTTKAGLGLSHVS